MEYTIEKIVDGRLLAMTERCMESQRYACAIKCQDTLLEYGRQNSADYLEFLMGKRDERYRNIMNLRFGPTWWDSFCDQVMALDLIMEQQPTELECNDFALQLLMYMRLEKMIAEYQASHPKPQHVCNNYIDNVRMREGAMLFSQMLANSQEWVCYFHVLRLHHLTGLRWMAWVNEMNAGSPLPKDFIKVQNAYKVADYYKETHTTWVEADALPSKAHCTSQECDKFDRMCDLVTRITNILSREWPDINWGSL